MSNTISNTVSNIVSNTVSNNNIIKSNDNSNSLIRTANTTTNNGNNHVRVTVHKNISSNVSITSTTSRNSRSSKRNRTPATVNNEQHPLWDKLVEFSQDLRCINYALPIMTVSVLVGLWLRLAFDGEVIVVWERSDFGIPSYLIAMKFSLTAIIILLIQHLYHYKLFKSMSDNDTIAFCNSIISIIVPGLLGAGIGAGLYRGIGCGVGFFLGCGVGNVLKTIWGDVTSDPSKAPSQRARNSHLQLWLAQFGFLSIYVITGILTCALSTSTSRFGLYLLLFAPTRLYVVLSSFVYFMCFSEPNVFNPLFGFFACTCYHVTQIVVVFSGVIQTEKVSYALIIVNYLLYIIFVAKFMQRNLSYAWNNKALDHDDLPRLTLVMGLLVYMVAIGVLNKYIYNLTSSQEISDVLILRLYAQFLAILYLSTAPSLVLGNEITNAVRELSQSRAEEITKYQILSQVIPKNLLKMTSDSRLIPIDHYNVCVFYSNIDIAAMSKAGAIDILKMMNDINCVMNICMNLCNVNRLDTNGNSYLAEAGVAYTDTMVNNIHHILRFAITVREALRRIFDNSIAIKMGLHCGHCVGKSTLLILLLLYFY